MTEIHISIPAIPPSANHYKSVTKRGHWYRTTESEDFAYKLALAARQYSNQKIEAEEVHIRLFLGKGDRMDVDNCAKLPIDSLVRCGVIRSDASITRLVVEKFREPDHPRTEMWIRGEPPKTSAPGHG